MSSQGRLRMVFGQRMDRYFLSLIALCMWAQISPAFAAAGLHTAPVIVQGSQIRQATGKPIPRYRLYKNDGRGRAIPVAYQIDEVNMQGDYVLDQGAPITAKTGDGIFDLQDELALMGDDIGPAEQPRHWPGPLPSEIYEIAFDYRGLAMPPAVWAPTRKTGAVYLALYRDTAPKTALNQYVVFNRQEAEVRTSRYRYGFDQKNWLVSRNVEMKLPPPNDTTHLQILDSTTFYLKADLKYFLTFEANHKSVSSELEAFKVGPVRTIVRISYFYTLLKLNFQLGMYTEISFFSNAIFLPAILYNPIDGPNALNSGSGFYYGLALKDNPQDYKIETNMEPWQESGLLSFLKKPFGRTLPSYWLSAMGSDRMLYLEMTPSTQMTKLGASPTFYQENMSGDAIKSRGNDKPRPLGKSPVNLGMYFDLTRFSEGDHMVGFRLYVENHLNPAKIESFKNMSKWGVYAKRLQ